LSILVIGGLVFCLTAGHLFALRGRFKRLARREPWAFLAGAIGPPSVFLVLGYPQSENPALFGVFVLFFVIAGLVVGINAVFYLPLRWQWWKCFLISVTAWVIVALFLQ